MIFPRHENSLTLTHNDFKLFYSNIKQWFEDDTNDRFQWENEESKKRAIETEEIWTLQWYPKTKLGFVAIAAPTLHELLQWANSGE